MPLIQSARDDPGADLSGRSDERRREAQGLDARKDLPWDQDPMLRRAYDRGRRDERARRRHRPGSAILSLLVLTAAAVGVFVIYLGVSEGSFSSAGRMVDNGVASAAHTTRQVTHQAASHVGDAVEGAGRSLKEAAPAG
jgi:hypothetical protein